MEASVRIVNSADEDNNNITDKSQSPVSSVARTGALTHRANRRITLSCLTRTGETSDESGDTTLVDKSLCADCSSSGDYNKGTNGLGKYVKHRNSQSNNSDTLAPTLDIILCPKKCKGAIVKCPHADLGCIYQGPRSALQSHLWECPYRDLDAGLPSPSNTPVMEGEVSTIDIQRGCFDLGFSFVGGIDTPLICCVLQEIFPDGVAAKDNRLQPGDQILEVNGVDLSTSTHTEAKAALNQIYPICRLTVYREKSDEDQPIEKEAKNRTACTSLKRKVRSGAMEESTSSVITKAQRTTTGNKAGRKEKWPRIVHTRHGRVCRQLIPWARSNHNKCTDGQLWNTFSSVTTNQVPGGMADLDGRLKKHDRIVEINCQNMSRGTQDQAARVIQASVDKVQFVISRKSRPETPDVVKSASQECLYALPNRDIVMVNASLKPCKEKTVVLHKEAMETLGISVAGGYGNPRGDIPIYITNIQPDGCVGRSKQVKRGDVILTINGHSLYELTHSEAVKVLKVAVEAKTASIRLLEGNETSFGVGNFTPSWKFWLTLPHSCYYVRTVVLERADSRTLGFSIVGGNDSGQGSVPIYIKSVVPNTTAGRDGRLRSGDQLLSVNGHNLEDVPHTHAVGLLKNSKGFITLQVVSWPGTSV